MKAFYEKKPKYICYTCDQRLFFRRDCEKCTKCKENFCLKHVFQYVDESNISITKNSPLYCRNCFREKYPRGY